MLTVINLSSCTWVGCCSLECIAHCITDYEYYERVHLEVTWISTTTGRFDIISITRFDFTDGLNEFINKVMPKIERLRDSEAFVCLHEGKGSYSLMYTLNP